MAEPVSGTPDDNSAYEEVVACLNLDMPRSFFLYAGAGSGKTRLLVDALEHIAETYGRQLGLRGQKVGVITYTNAACEEILRRKNIGSTPLFHVSTIHSFAWDLIRPFPIDIREWLRANLVERTEELRAEEAKGRPGTQASITRLAKIDANQARLEYLGEIKRFIYSPTGDNRERDSLSHSEVIEICAGLLKKLLMQRILINRYPILFIDESQDTHRLLIDSLMQVEAAHRDSWCFGLIGDMMQRIYGDGKAGIERELPKEWARPRKLLNYRCPKRVVRLLNQVRSEVDNHVQQASDERIDGCVRLFLISTASTPDREDVEQRARAHMSACTGDAEWTNRDSCKVLTLEHHMAATRLGFEKVFSPLYEVDGFRTGLLDGTLPAVRFFTNDVLPLVQAQQEGDKFKAARVVREASPLLSRSSLEAAADPIVQIRVAQDAVLSLMALWDDGEPSCGEVLDNVAASNLFSLPDSLKPLLKLREASRSSNSDEERQQEPPSNATLRLQAFLEAPFSQVQPYALYVSGLAPFGTHQGVKGLEFDRVMVIMDDSEARGFMFDYDKLLGAKDRSATDIKNEAEGKETSLDRTRRLFYVTSSRTKKSLALVVYSSDPARARTRVLQSKWFEEDEIILM
ncbi:MAG: AAA family ATPase [Actinobacteria bacterium]|nr:AAA family ATPase [Actinomycetota bacterium]